MESQPWCVHNVEIYTASMSELQPEVSSRISQTMLGKGATPPKHTLEEAAYRKAPKAAGLNVWGWHGVGGHRG